MTDFVPEGAFELAGCPSIGGLGEPRVPGYTGGSGGPITLQVGDKPEYNPLLRFAQPTQAPSASGSTGAPVRGGSYRRATAHQNYGGPEVYGSRSGRGVPFYNLGMRRSVLGLGTFYVNGVGNCVPCGVSGLGGTIYRSGGSLYRVKAPTWLYAQVGGRGRFQPTVPIAAGVLVEASPIVGGQWVRVYRSGGADVGEAWLRSSTVELIDHRRHLLGLGAFSIDSLGLGLNLKTLIIVVAAAFAGSWVLRKMKKPHRRNRRRNAPFAVKGVFGAIGPARAAYAAMPGGGYKSLIDVNRRKGRSGRYSSRKIVAQHRLPAGSF